MGSNYETKWQEYRQLRRLDVLAFGGFVVLALIVATVSNYYFQTFTPCWCLRSCGCRPISCLAPLRVSTLPALQPPLLRLFSDITKACSAGLASIVGSARMRTADARQLHSKDQA
jgi:hypothetical protein